MEKFRFDFIVIGCGLAGLNAALNASKFGTVALLNKSTMESSNSYWAQGGIAAAIGEGDDPKFHFDDTIVAGRGLCDENAVNVLVNDGVERIRELINLGMPFDRINNEIALGLEGGHGKRRILHADGDATGREVIIFLTGVVKKISNIKIFENTYVHSLITDGNICTGAYTYNYKEKMSSAFTGGSVILATGGASGIYSRTTNPHTSTGDGVSLAYNAGCEIASMEFNQFHPTSFYTDIGDTFLISEAVRGEGAYLVNRKGERFMLGKHELNELAPRDVVASSIFYEMKASGEPDVFLTLDHLDPVKIKKRFSNTYREALRYNVDITKDPVPVAPAAHYTIGGILTDLNGRTNIENLYACGEAAYTGVHGANRLASNSLLECLVFSKRAVEDIVDSGIEKNINADIRDIEFMIDDSKEEEFRSAKKAISSVMNEHVGIIRSEELINHAINEIDKRIIDFEFVENEYYSTRMRSLIDVSMLICDNALLRSESRGAHIRSDFPGENQGMSYIIVQTKDVHTKIIPVL